MADSDPCPAPFVAESTYPATGGYIAGRFCGAVSSDVSCCLPCPAQTWIFGEKFEKNLKVANWASLASVACCSFVLLSFIVLPPEKSRRNYLSVGLTIAILFIALPFTIPLGTKPDLCWNDITPNDSLSDGSCAWTGALLPIGALGTAIWVLMRTVWLHLIVCWNYTPGRVYNTLTGLAGILLPIAFTLAIYYVTGVSYNIGTVCFPNHAHSAETFWAWFVAFAGLSFIVQVATSAYCVWIYTRVWAHQRRAAKMASMDSNYSHGQSTTGSQRFLLAEDIKMWKKTRRMLLLQWRTITLTLVVTIESLYFMITFWTHDIQFAKVEEQWDNIVEAKEWVACLVLTGGEIEQCLPYAKMWAGKGDTLVNPLILAAIVGIEVLLLTVQSSLIKGWWDILSMPFRSWSRKQSRKQARRDIHDEQPHTLVPSDEAKFSPSKTVATTITTAKSTRSRSRSRSSSRTSRHRSHMAISKPVPVPVRVPPSTATASHASLADLDEKRGIMGDPIQPTFHTNDRGETPPPPPLPLNPSRNRPSVGALQSTQSPNFSRPTRTASQDGAGIDAAAAATGTGIANRHRLPSWARNAEGGPEMRDIRGGGLNMNPVEPGAEGDGDAASFPSFESSNHDVQYHDTRAAADVDADAILPAPILSSTSKPAPEEHSTPRDSTASSTYPPRKSSLSLPAGTTNPRESGLQSVWSEESGSHNGDRDSRALSDGAGAGAVNGGGHGNGSGGAYDHSYAYDTRQSHGYALGQGQGQGQGHVTWDSDPTAITPATTHPHSLTHSLPPALVPVAPVQRQQQRHHDHDLELGMGVLPGTESEEEERDVGLDLGGFGGGGSRRGSGRKNLTSLLGEGAGRSGWEV